MIHNFYKLQHLDLIFDFEMSTDASVCPTSKTPPDLATRGKRLVKLYPFSRFVANCYFDSFGLSKTKFVVIPFFASMK